MGHPRRFERAPATFGFSRSPLSSPIRAREPRSEAAAAADRTIPNQPTELPGRLRHQPIAKSAALAVSRLCSLCALRAREAGRIRPELWTAAPPISF
jgi:hypothetical protein